MWWLGQFVGGRKEKKGKKKGKQERKEKNKRKGTGPASWSGQTQTGSERNCATRFRCLPSSILFYA